MTPRVPGSVMTLAGCAALALPLGVAVPHLWPLGAVGAALVAASWRWHVAAGGVGLVAVVLAALAAFGDAFPVPLAAAEGLLLLVFLLAVDIAAAPPRHGRAHLAYEVGALLAGAVVVTSVVAAAAAMQSTRSTWLVFAGLAGLAAAAVAAGGPPRRNR